MSTSRTLRILKNLAKAVAFGLILGVMLLLLWRIFSSGAPKKMDVLTPNDSLVSAYEEHGNDLYMFKQDHKNITTAPNNRGYFSVIDYVIIPEANQIQLIFRYNNSTIRQVAEDKGIDPVPEADAYLFDVSLCIMTDLTPDNDKDNEGNIKESVEYTRILPTDSSHAQKTLYNYYRYVFEIDEDRLSLSKLMDSGELLAVFADVYYVEEIDYEKTPYGTLCLYDYATDKVTVRLSSADRSAIKKFTEDK